MKDLLKKQLLLAFVVILSLFSGHSMVVARNEVGIPFSSEYQEILDDVVKKIKEGKPGDYKGYTVFNVPYLAKVFTKDKKICLDHDSLYTLSKDEIKFELGRQVGYTLPNMDQKYVVEQAISRAGRHYLGFSFLGTLVGACPAVALSIRNDWSDVTSIGVVGAAGIAGGLIFSVVANYCGYGVACITSALQKREYDLDEMSAEKLNCHEAAINYIGKLVYSNVPAAKTIPSNKDRIARLEELRKKKQQN